MYEIPISSSVVEVNACLGMPDLSVDRFWHSSSLRYRYVLFKLFAVMQVSTQALSNPVFTANFDFDSTLRYCSNKPYNAYYVESSYDSNDCPWECNDGYYESSSGSSCTQYYDSPYYGSSSSSSSPSSSGGIKISGVSDSDFDLAYCASLMSKNQERPRFTKSAIEYACIVCVASGAIGVLGGLIRFTAVFCCMSSVNNVHDRFLESFLVAINLTEWSNSVVWKKWTAVAIFYITSGYYMVMVAVAASKAFGCRCNITCLDCCTQATRLLIASFLPLFIVVGLSPFLICYFAVFGKNQSVQPQEGQPAQEQEGPAEQAQDVPAAQSQDGPTAQSQDKPADQSPANKV